jgi:Putative beta barrel porin-7 (BBP7)
MPKQVFTAMLALAAINGLALGGDESLTPPALQPTSVPASQAASPPSPVSTASTPRTGSFLDSEPGPDLGEPCAKADWACGPPGRIWVSAEYLLWWVKDSRLPPLATTGPAIFTQSSLPGALGGLGTAGLFGGDGLDRDPFSGGRFTAGYWFNCAQTKGIEASYFFLGSRSNDFGATSSGAPGSSVLARPFFDVSSGLQNSELIAFPGLASGTVGVHSTTRLQGAEANMICNLCCSCGDCGDCGAPARSYRVDLISGFRYLDLREGLGVVEDTQILPGSPLIAPADIRAFDQFDTRNQFYGGQVGVRAEARQNRFFANVTGKLALGDTHQTVDINGATTITPLGGTAIVRPGGLLALPTNSGRFSRDVFSVVPEGSVNVGYQFTNNLRFSVGYTFLYWSGVARPGDAVDLRVNSTRVPTSLLPPSGPAAPLFAFRGSDFWAQGMTFGVQLLF